MPPPPPPPFHPPMDIKNILNESERRANTASAPSAQQIVYTGPVYQFQPAVELHHPHPVDTIQYRYPYPYEEQGYAYTQRQYPRYTRPPTPPRHPTHHHHSTSSLPIPRTSPTSPPRPYRRYRTPRQFSPPSRPFRRAGLPAACPPAPSSDHLSPHETYAHYREPVVSYVSYHSPYPYGTRYKEREESTSHTVEVSEPRVEKGYEKVGRVDGHILHEIDMEMPRNRARKRERRLSPIRRPNPSRYSQFEQGYRAVAMDRELARRDEQRRREQLCQQRERQQQCDRMQLMNHADQTQLLHESQPEPEPEPEPKQESRQEPERRLKCESKCEPKREPKLGPKHKPKLGPKHEPKLGPKHEPKHGHIHGPKYNSVRSERDEREHSMMDGGGAATLEADKEVEVIEISSANENEGAYETDSDTVSECEDVVENGVKEEQERLAKSTPRAADPDEPYPERQQEFGGIKASAIGDMLQLWEFVTAFSKTLKLSSFSLEHLQQATVHEERSTLLDSCLIRLVRTIVADRALVQDLDISDAVVNKLTAKWTKNAVGVILEHLPLFLSFDSDEVDDQFLHDMVQRLEKSTDRWAFYKILPPEGKLRILRELVNYATMTDVLRDCVVDSMEHAEEEKKKAKEENAANRKKLEQQLKELKTELTDYRVKNGLVDVTQESDKEKNGIANGKKEPSDDSSKEEPRSRKDKLLAAKRERKEEEHRRIKERGEESIIARMDKVRGQLKALKNIRLRNRDGRKDGELFDGSLASPNMPFTAPHEDPVRTHPMGTDREDRCYWFFEGSGKLWIEDTSSGEWWTLNDEEGLELLIRWLSPYRPNEKELKDTLRKRKDHMVAEMHNETKRREAAEAEAELNKQQESEAERTPRMTRAGKRKADIKAKAGKAKKSKVTGTFLDYRNLEK